MVHLSHSEGKVSTENSGSSKKVSFRDWEEFRHSQMKEN